MSDPGGESTPPPSATPPQRSGCLTAFMLVAGIILMLPGLCAIVVGAGSAARFDPSLALIVFVCVAIGLGGFALVISAVRGRR